MMNWRCVHRSLAAIVLGSLIPAGLALAQDAEANMPFSASATGRQATFPGGDGKQIYERICQGCHMDNGAGARQGPSAYPPVAANPKFAARIYPAVVTVSGLGAMPAFGTLLNDEQVAAVVNYVRTSFANSYADPVSAAEVQQVRPTAQARPTELRGR